MLQFIAPFIIINRKLMQHGRKRETIDLIAEHNEFTWECNLLATSPSSLWFSREREQNSMNYFNLCAAPKMEFLIFHIQTLHAKQKTRMSYSNKQKGKQETKNLAAAFIQVYVPVA